MYIPDSLIRGLKNSTRPIILYRNEEGDFIDGFVLRADEFVASLSMLNELRKAVELPIAEA